jgi:uncharacterized protein
MKNMALPKWVYLAPMCVGNKKSDSDIDILISLTDPPRIDLLDLIELEHYLSDLLGRKVDVAIKKNLRKRIGKRILSEVQPI